jgi:solute carrier family 20 (sodium-dependent phosphate transporter)
VLTRRILLCTVIASIFEFSGAFFLGASVTGTIRSKIVDTSLYKEEPALLMFGMLSALISANIFLFIATALGMPVSTTHDIVGSIMGFSIAAKGFDSVQWKVAIKIFISWIISPVFAGSVAAAIFATVKYAVLRSPNPYRRAYWTFPIVLTGGVGINVFYVLYKAANNFKAFQEGLELYIVLPAAFAAGAGCGLIWMFIIGPIAKRRVEAKREALADEKETTKGVKSLENRGDSEVLADDDDVPYKDGEVFDVDGDDEPTREGPLAVSAAAAEPTTMFGRLTRGFADATYDRDIEAESMHENKRAVEIWSQAEDYDLDTENLFTYLQVFTACLNSFAHGANDVSNTIAPMSAIITIYQTGKVPSKSPVPKWMLAFGGGAIVLGLLLYGYNVMKSLGYKLTKLSPSRGFSAELGASLVVVTASFNEIPVSSTQCIVGAVFGVGLVGGCKDVQWLFLLKVMVSWAGLFLCASVFAAGVFSFGAFSPTA